jgi:small basic protein
MFGGGLGAASVLLVGMALGLAVIAAAVYTLGFRLYRDGVFQRVERQA